MLLYLFEYEIKVRLTIFSLYCIEIWFLFKVIFKPNWYDFLCHRPKLCQQQRLNRCLVNVFGYNERPLFLLRCDSYISLKEQEKLLGWEIQQQRDLIFARIQVVGFQIAREEAPWAGSWHVIPLPFAWPSLSISPDTKDAVLQMTFLPPGW